MTTRDPDRPPRREPPKGGDEDRDVPPPGAVLVAATLVYGLLTILAYAWLAWRDRIDSIAPSAIGQCGTVAAVAVGTATAFALFGVMCLLVRYVPAFTRLDVRIATILGPLRDRDAIALALVSGAAEEFFFRCASLDAMGWLVTTVLYALGHLGGRHLWLLTVSAAVLGGILAGLVLAGFGLLSAAMAHALFNYLWMQRLVIR